MAADLVCRADAQLAKERHGVFARADVEVRAVLGEAGPFAVTVPHALPNTHVVVEDAERAVAEQVPLAPAVVVRPANLRADKAVFNVDVVVQLVVAASAGRHGAV